VSNRLAPRIAPPVSCATHIPSALLLSMPVSTTGAPSGTKRGSAAALTPGVTARPSAPSGPGPVSSWKKT
jgi:hypothetical protein